MLPIIEEDVVDKYHWIKKEEFIDYVAVAQSLSRCVRHQLGHLCRL